MKIKLLAMDVDGTLTDGHIYMGAEGEVFKAFDVKDGYAIANLLPLLEIVPVIITGRTSVIVERRAAELGILELHQGVGNKLEKLIEIALKYHLSGSEVAYIGDDLNDIPCIDYAGFSGCPCDAVEEVKKAVNYDCDSKAGRGAVREFIEEMGKKNEQESINP